MRAMENREALAKDIGSTHEKIADLKLQGVRDKADIEKQMGMQFCDLKAQAIVHKDDIEKHSESCCCELKERIAGSECSIKGTIEKSDIECLRDKLHQLEIKNTVLESKREHDRHIIDI